MAGIGEALRSTRERRGLSIDEVARETRISPRFLEALEAEQFDELPAPVYVRGFLRSYANYLKIEAQPLLDRLIGGDVSMPKAAGGYVARESRTGAGVTSRRNDPFQRSGVVAAPPLPARPNFPRAEPEVGDADDSWSPEPLAPFTAPHEDNGYVPGSDLMESPEYAFPEEETNFEPRRRRSTAGVLAERPPGPNDPGVSRRVALFGGGVLAVLAFLAIAVVMTRGEGDDGNNRAGAGGDFTPGITPGSVIPVGTRTTTPSASASPGASASASASAAAGATGTATAAGTPGATTTPPPTPGAGTPTSTATPGQSATTAPTAAPAATATPAPPTSTPVPQPTPIPVRAENSAFGECAPTNGSYNCGAPPYRVICFSPLGFPQNRNWWVDVDRSFGAVPDGWKEFDGLMSNGAIINAGQSLCATP